MSEARLPRQKLNERSIAIVRPVVAEAETIINIRDGAWLDRYTNPELGFPEEVIRLVARGRDDELRHRKIASVREQIVSDTDTLGRIFLAKVGSLAVGYSEHRLDAEGRSWVAAMFVSPPWQGRGVGGKLMRHLLSEYGSDQDLHLDVVAHNYEAKSFYGHYGFKMTNTFVPIVTGVPKYFPQIPQDRMVRPAQ